MDAKLESIQSKVSEIPAIVERIHQIESSNSRRDIRLDTAQGEIDRIRNHNTIWSGLNSIGVLIGTAIGLIK
jgi:hypothetical protein